MQSKTLHDRIAQVPGILGNLLLWVLAFLGLCCIILVVIAKTQSMSLVMFSTGSMSPTIPAGSVALVRQVPAGNVAPGDIVTIDRVDKLPVTHRVVSIKPVGYEQWELVMRGDANEQNDPEPYVVSEVRTVLGHVPGLAKVIVWFQQPWVMGALTVIAALIVTWAFWPRPAGRRARE